MCGNFFSRFDSRCVVVQFPPSVSTIDQFTDSDAHRARWLHDMIRWIATPKSCMNVRIKHSSVDRNRVTRFAHLNINDLNNRLAFAIPRHPFPHEPKRLQHAVQLRDERPRAHLVDVGLR